LRFPSPERWFWPATCALLACMGLSMTRAALEESLTYDEGFHLVAGFSYWKTGDYRLNPEHPPLSKLLSAAPLLFTSAQMPHKPDSWRDADMTGLFRPFLFENRVSADQLLFLGRLPIIGVTLCLGLMIALWARRRFSAGAALLALALYATDANFLAHGHYVTTDVLASLGIFLAAVTWVGYLETGRGRDLLWASLALGVALASKFSALYLLGVHPLLYLLFRAKVGHRRVYTALAGSAVVLALAYGPETLRMFSKEGVEPLSKQIPTETRLGALAHQAAVSLHLPAHKFLLGFGMLAQHNAEGHNSYLLGKTSKQGDWRYFPVAFAVKTPSGTLLLLAFSLVAFPLRLAWPPWKVALLTYPAAYMALSIGSNLHIGLRHLLPLYPFLFVLTGAAMTNWKHRRHAVIAVAAVLTIHGVELARTAPHYLAFFNTFAGGAANGPRYLLDSNIDWGQDASRLKSWMERSKLDEVCLSYFGSASAEDYGIRHMPLLHAPTDAERARLDCIAAISVNNLYDLYMPAGTHAWARRLKPFSHIGHSIYLYDLRKDRSQPLLP